MRLMLLASLCLTAPLLAHAQSADIYNPSEPVVSQAPSQLNTTQPDGVSATIYSNGPYVTNTGTGPGGSDVSLLQNTSLGLNSLGANCSVAGGFSVADDFVVPAGQTWNITGARFFAYQTGAATAPSTFNSARYQIWSGRPGDVGSTVLFGDLTTNRFVGSSWSNAYRTSEGPVGTTRPIMTTEANAASPITLNPGTYWIDWQLGGTAASGPWCPSISIIGTTVTGDAVQSSAGAYAPLVDSSTTSTPPTPPQGLPFALLGSIQMIGPGVLTPSSTSVAFGNQQVGFNSNSTITLSNTGLSALSVTGLTGPIAPFSIVGGTCGAVPFSLAAGANCTIQIRFTPTVAGSVTGSLVVNTDVPSTSSIALSGNGVAINATLIPTNATWGLLALLGVILSLGMLAVSRRNG